MSVDYNAVAPRYDARYDANPLEGVAGLLRRLAREAGSGQARVLEVGCGTGFWLALLDAVVGHTWGLDLSTGMLRQAQRRAPGARLIQGQAGALPWVAASFDLIICVNALHHFPDPRGWVAEARRLLRPGGTLVNVGLDPRAGRDRWYLYDYFPGTLETDQRRFSSAGTLVDWVKAAGFEQASWLTAEHIFSIQRGRTVLDDPFLQKHGTSQLALLSDAAYQAGLTRLRQALDAAEAAGEAVEFVSDLWLSAVVAQAPGRR
jgi:SAM-dependent methyltransferase